MSDEPFDSKTVKHGPLTFLIEWLYDSDGDASFLGEPTSKPQWDGAVYDLWTNHLWVKGHGWYDESGNQLSEDVYETTVDDAASGDIRKHRYIEGFQSIGPDADSRRACFEDVKRLRGLWSEKWWFTGCRVTLTVDGEELAQDSLWSIESDSDDDYKKEVETERINECKAQALDSLPKTVERLNKLIHILVDLVPKALKP